MDLSADALPAVFLEIDGLIDHPADNASGVYLAEIRGIA
jgi:hypothetical protein